MLMPGHRRHTQIVTVVVVVDVDCWCPSRTRMVFTYAGDVGIRGLERARVDTGPGVACAHYLFKIQAAVTGEWHWAHRVTEACLNNVMSATTGSNNFLGSLFSDKTRDCIQQPPSALMPAIITDFSHRYQLHFYGRNFQWSHHSTSHYVSTSPPTLYSDSEPNNANKINGPFGENRLLAHVSSWVGRRVDRRAGRVMGFLCNWGTKWIWHLKFGTTRVTQVPRPDMRGWGGEAGSRRWQLTRDQPLSRGKYVFTPCPLSLTLSHISIHI